jgi:predicted TIM-barrel fold metal-dependent hydrolase
VRILDAHVRPPAGHPTRVAAALLSEMDAAGIDAALVSPAEAEIAVRNREGNERILAVAHERPERLLAYATANPWNGAEAAAELDRALSAGAAAVLVNSALQGFPLLDELVDPVIEVARAHGVPVYAHTGTPAYALPLQLAELALRFPDVAFVMGRAGRTDFRMDALPALEAAPNVYADLSHEPPQTGIAALAAAVGPERLVFASDHPVRTMASAVARLEGAPLDAADRERVAGGTLRALLEAA